MTAEQLNQANGFKTSIDAFKKHKSEIEHILYNGIAGGDIGNVTLQIVRSSYNTRQIFPDFFPIDPRGFFRLYLSLIDEKVKELENQFAEV